MKEFKSELKIIWSYLSKYKGKVWLLSFLAVADSAILAVIPYIYGRLIDSAKEPLSGLEAIFVLLFLWLLINIVNVFFLNIVNKQSGFLSVVLYSDVILKASSHLMKLPLSFHREKKIGEIYSRIERAARALENITDDILFWIIPQILTALLGLAILFFVSWPLALGVFAVFLIYVLLTVYKTSPIIKRQKEMNKAFEEVSGNLYDSVINSQTIKSSSAEEYQQERARKDYQDKLGSIYRDFVSMWHSLNLWQNIFYSFSFVFLFGGAVLMLKKDMISVGQLVMFFGYINMAYAPLRVLGWNWKNYRTGIATLKRVQDLLEEEQEDYNQQGVVLEDLKGKVEFKNVSFGYKGKGLTLKDISFSVLPGQKIALVGGSGEGKTTLVDLISLYFKPSQGQILVDDIDANKFNLSYLRSNIAYVPQDIMLFNDTIKNNIKFGSMSATDEQVKEAAKLANADSFILSFPDKYEQVVGERGIRLSAGQKQRIAIARALLRNPKILILDEATSALDSKTEKLVQSALEKLVQNRTTFIIAHRLSTVRIADKILVLEKGNIVEEGTHEELLEKKGAFFKFYSLQFMPEFIAGQEEKREE